MALTLVPLHNKCLGVTPRISFFAHLRSEVIFMYIKADLFCKLNHVDNNFIKFLTISIVCNFLEIKWAHHKVSTGIFWGPRTMDRPPLIYTNVKLEDLHIFKVEKHCLKLKCKQSLYFARES